MNKTELEAMDIEAVAKAIEEDAGHALPGLRASLEQTKAGQSGRIYKRSKSWCAPRATSWACRNPHSPA